MLKTVKVANSASADRLVKLWTARYLPDFSILPAAKGKFPANELINAASSEGRDKTVTKVVRSLQINCERAGLEAHDLFSYIPNIVNLSDARQISGQVSEVYRKTLNIYKRQQCPSYYLRYIDTSLLFSKLAMPALMLPFIQKMAEEVEPMLLRLQAQHVSAEDSRTIGFITTNFHFSTRSLLKQLSPCEQILLSPYLKFVEEQVCIPWQRLCAAASAHSPNSAVVQMIEALLEMSPAISQSVYDRALKAHPHHRSRRGSLRDLGIRSSTLRDLNMFQGYLWLCVLENNMSAIEQELLPLCVAVFPSVEVKWDLVEAMLKDLEAEIHTRVNASQSDRLRPYTQSLRQIFTLPRSPISMKR